MKIRNLSFVTCLVLVLAGLSINSSVSAQPLSLTKEEMVMYTPLWKGERFPDGRPKVSDDIIARMKYVTITEAWGSLQGMTDTEAAAGGGTGFRRATYTNQYYGGFKQMFNDVTICGRAATIQFMPFRPDVNQVINEQGKLNGKTAAQFTWGIDQLNKGDVYVANVCEGFLDASHVGDNMGTTIWTRSGNGAIIRGTVRDTEGNMSMEGFNMFVRDFRPESNASNMVIGINGPIQIGYVAVMPGDVVLAKFEGVIFIPAHLAEQVVVSSEESRMRDVFAHAGVKEGRFTAAQADGGYTEAMNKEFNQWLRDNANTMSKYFDDPKAAPSTAFILDYAKRREAAPARPR